jgi:hypothetical protein
LTIQVLVNTLLESLLPFLPQTGIWCYYL